MEIQSLNLNGKKINVYIEDDDDTVDTLEKSEDLEKTKEIALEDIKKQLELDKTIIIEKKINHE